MAGAVDRGGLKYPVEVIDRFSANLQRFRDEIRKSRAEFVGFRRTARKLSADTSKGEASSRRQAAQATKAEASAVREKLKAIKQTSDTERIRDRLRASATKDQKREAQRLVKEEASASRAKLKAIDETAKRQRVTERLRASAIRDQRKEAKRLSAEQAKAGKKFRGSLKKTEGAANRIAFTFRRLFGILAAFTLARGLVSAFGGLIAGGVRFNQQIEQSKLGLAGIFAAVGDVRDAQGELVTGQEKFSAATRVAADQQAKLRQESLNTVATFEELLSTFQVAVAPGLAAGLSLDEIRLIAVRVTQAAQAIGVPLNQLSEEIRALLTGNIRQTTSRIAVALGLTPSTIKNARRLGTLATILNNRLAAFGETSDRVAKTLTGTFARLRGVFQELTAAGAGPLVDSLASALQGLIEKLTTVKNIDGREVRLLKPEAVEAVTAVFQVLADLIDRVAVVVQSIDLTSLATRVSDFGDAIVSGFEIALELFKALGPAAGAFLDVLQAVAPAIQSLAPLLVLFFQLKAILFVTSSIAGVLLKTFTLLAAPVVFFTASARAARKEMKGVNRVVGAIQVGLLGALVGAGAILEAAFDTKFTYGQVAKLIASSLVDALDAAVTASQQLVDNIKVALALDLAGERGFFGTLIDSAAKLGLSFQEAINRFIGFENVADLNAASLKKRFEDDDALRRKLGLDTIDETARVQEARDQERQARRVKFENEIGKILAEGSKGAGFDATVAKVKKLLSDIKKDTNAGLRGDSGFAVTGKLKPLTEGEEDKFFKERQSFKLLQSRTLLTLELARIEASQTTEIEKQVAASRAREISANAELDTRLVTLDRLIKKAQEESKSSRGDADAQIELAAKLTRLEKERGLARDKLTALVVREVEARRVLAIQARGIISVGNERITQLKLERDLALEKLEADRQALLETFSRETDPLKEVTLRQQILDIDKQITAERALQGEIIENEQFKLALASARARGAASEGLQFGALAFANQFKNSFDAALDLAKQSLERFAGFVTTVIGDAFDPNKDTNIKERFGKFLQDIAKLIFQMFVRLAIAKAILGLAGPAAGGPIGPTPSGAPLGFYKGGRVPGRRSQASLAHYGHPQGLAEGGRPTPPAGIDKKDNVPIWAQQGEFMMRVAAVQKYGVAFMDSLNRGILDPGTLKSMAGPRRQSGRHSRSAGYAVGGTIGGGVATDAARSAQAQGGDGGSGQIAAAFIMADDQAVDRFLAGGQGAFLDLFDEHGADIEGRLARHRS